MVSQAELGGGRGAGAKKSGYSPRSTRASLREKIVAEPHAASQNAVTSVDSNAWGAVLPWEQKCIWRTATYAARWPTRSEHGPVRTGRIAGYGCLCQTLRCIRLIV